MPRLECKWHGDSIEVVKSVRIDPPYTAKECQSLTGDKMGMDRIILMVGYRLTCSSRRAHEISAVK